MSREESEERAGWGGALAVLGAVAAVAAFVALNRPGDMLAQRAPLGKSFEYDLSAFRKVDPRLIRFDEVAAIRPGTTNLRALAVGPDDRLAVAAGAAVALLDREGGKLGSFEVGSPVHALAFGDDGTLWVGRRDRVEGYSAEGVLRTAGTPLGTNAYLTAVAARGDRVFAADAGNRVVYRFDASGRLLRRIGEKNPAREEPGFIVPSPYFDIALGPDDSLWVVDPGRHEFRNYRDNGERRASWTGPASLSVEGFSGCCNPTHIALRPDGSFVTSEKGIERVKIHGPSGEFLSVVAGPQSFAEGERGLDLAVDSRGRILVLDPQVHSVRVFVERPEAPKAPEGRP